MGLQGVLQGAADMEDNRREQVNRLMLLYEKDILKLCFGYLHNVDLAREAMQETFLKAYTRWHTFRGEASEKTWLTHIAANTCRDHLQSAWFRHRRLEVPADSLPLSSPPPDETRLDLMDAIMNLPVRNREVILLKYRQNLTSREIAKALRITPAAVSKRLSQAYALLKLTLEGEDEDE